MRRKPSLSVNLKVLFLGVHHGRGFDPQPNVFVPPNGRSRDFCDLIAVGGLPEKLMSHPPAKSFFFSQKSV